MFKLDLFSRLGLKVIVRSASSKHGSKKVLMELRNKTGYPLINCRQALKANNYNLEKAEQSLMAAAKEKGWDKMANLTKNMKEGLVSVLSNKNTAVIVEVNCQTDFVAKTTDFQKVVKEVAYSTLNKFSGMEPGKVNLSGEEILGFENQGNAGTLKDSVAVAIGRLREAIAIRRASVVSVSPQQNLAIYVHPSLMIKPATSQTKSGSYAALVAITSLDETASLPSLKLKGRELAQHCVGMKPLTIGTSPEPVIIHPQSEENEDVTSSDEKNMTSSAEESENMTSPGENAPLNTDVNLTDSDAPSSDGESYELLPPDDASDELLKQPFLLDGDVSVAHWLKCNSIKVDDFVRYQVGEDVEGA